jgi:formylglycine-generating enzyme required for sulfatase activity
MSNQSAQDKGALKRTDKLLNNFCSFIPSGNALVGTDTVSVQAFYMSKTEITNFQYNEFLWYLKRHERWDDLKVAQVDSTKWNQNGWGNNAYAQHYHRHPAYKEYPVVNITKEGAELYCEWLTMMYDSISQGAMKIKFRIPTRAEQIRAARGDDHFAVYPWKGAYLRNSKGSYLCNFLALNEENIARSESGGFEVKLFEGTGVTHYSDILAPAKSYWPNEFGIYNISGNVSEMIADENVVLGGDWRSPGYNVRITSSKPYTGAGPEVGFRVVASVLDK